MTIKDITILKSLTPITFLDKPSKKTIEFLAQIVQESTFVEYAQAIRSMNNFPKDGIPLDEFEGKNFNELPVFNNSLVRLTFENTMHDFCKDLGLSDDMNENMMLLLIFSAFIDIEYFEGFITKPIQFLVGRKNISSTMFDYDYEVGAIIIPFNLSQNSLIKWIENKKNWSNIQEQMDDNLTKNPYMQRLHKNTELALEIVDLKDEQKLSFPKISDLLSTKYPEDKRMVSEEWVKKTYYDYKEMWNALSNSIKE